MFPNPQDALPHPPHPSIEQYRTLAKELVKACRSGDRDAVGVWADRWVESLFRSLGQPPAGHGRQAMDRAAAQVEEFAVRKLKTNARTCVLADAQFVIARSHGFHSWAKFVSHLDALAQAGTETAGFEAAADAVVEGDEVALGRLLGEQPALITARSAREHRATLLHYVSANGVEGYRQRTPPNVVEIARVLLAAGAEVDAEADVYGGGCTTLGLVATSAHPRDAGVQIPLLQLLLDKDARIEHPNLAGNDHGAVFACLANGCHDAAVYLAGRGARLDLVGAAGIGRLDVVRGYFDQSGAPKPDTTRQQMESALRQSCGWGHADVAEYLLERGADPDAGDVDGHTALHHAVYGGHLPVIELLLAQGARPGARSRYGDVVGAAAWRAAHGGEADRYVAIIEALVAAGAKVPERHPPVNARVDAVLARHDSVADPSRYWWGEEPRKRKS
ncbi:MAG TPA: ankyrin repeat domain-containing protein [Gemmatimonadales bacterium]|nr:ankyrin repeat domain-containing protein [Gemmatimonadales bacterium]